MAPSDCQQQKWLLAHAGPAQRSISVLLLVLACFDDIPDDFE